MLQTETLDHCPVCGGKELRKLLVAADHESHTGSYGIDECMECGIGITNPRPLAAELPKLYEQRSSADFPRMDGIVQRLRDFSIDRYLAAQFGGLLPAGDAPFAVLDYGCGDGAVTRGLVRSGRKQGRALHVTAVDFHSSAPPALADCGATVSYQPNPEWHGRPGRYDAIFLRHVLEHHPEPLQLLGTFAATLQPHGRLFVEVPNRRSVWARVFRENYFGYYLPRHLFHYDAASLERALRKAGFNRVTVGGAHTPLIGRSLGYLLGKNIGNTGLFGLATYPGQVAIDVMCGTSTTLRAIASIDG